MLCRFPYPERRNRKAVSICLATASLLTGLPDLAGGSVVTIAQQPRSEQAPSGVYVAYDGKDQFRLDEAKRIPAGAFASLRGYPLPQLLPEVRLRRSDTQETQQLEVSREPKLDAWEAPLPTLSPNTKAEITIRQFYRLERAETELIRETLKEMTLSVAEAVVADLVPPDADALEVGRAIEEYLTRRYPPERTLAQFVLIEGGRARQETLGQRLVQLLGTAALDDLAFRNLSSDYIDAFNSLDEVVRPNLANEGIPPEMRAELRRLWDSLPDSLFAQRAEVRSLWLRQVLKREPAVVPITDASAAALRQLLTVTVPAEQEARRSRLNAMVEILARPLDQRFPALFEAARRVESTTYSVSNISLPLFMQDLLRYGTVDFVAGQLLQGGDNESRGFLTFSFHPSAPQERTPHALESRVTLAIGFSVTGGGDDDQELFLAGLTIRLNRFVSFTVGAVTPTGAGDPTCCFVGLAGDVTTLPFLSELFTVKP